MGVPEPARPPDVDVTRLERAEDRHPVLAEWRAQSPLVGLGLLQWGVTRHADVVQLTRDRRVGHRMPRAYLEFALGDGPGTDFRQNSLLNRDPPDHTRLRRLMSKAFSRSLVQQLRGSVVALVDELVAPLLDGEIYDVAEDLAFPLPSHVVCDLLGLPRVDRASIGSRVTAIFGPDQVTRDEATVWMRDYIGAALADRRPKADGDLLERMLAAEDGDDALTHAEIVDNAVLLFAAGVETTQYLISASFAALLAHPDQLDRLYAEPLLAEPAVEEMLRYDTPVTSFAVYVHETLDVGPYRLHQGDALHLLMASANHDEAVFKAPTQLDIARDPNPHVSFGGGLHLCLGATLARLEGEVVLRRFAETTRSLVAAGPVRRGPVRSFVSLPVVASAR